VSVPVLLGFNIFQVKMNRENIYKASELDSRILKIDQDLLSLANKTAPEIVIERSLLPELFEEARKKKIEALKVLKVDYLKQIKELS
jgi:hypothetical protein